jgi:sec-independent protein translocase protein TatA
MFADLMRPGALIILLLVVLVLFGAKRLPEASKALGQSLRIFKAETKGLMDDDDDETTKPAIEAQRSTPEATPVKNPVQEPGQSDLDR